MTYYTQKQESLSLRCRLPIQNATQRPVQKTLGLYLCCALRRLVDTATVPCMGLCSSMSLWTTNYNNITNGG